jgi:hypothetical protein
MNVHKDNYIYAEEVARKHGSRKPPTTELIGDPYGENHMSQLTKNCVDLGPIERDCSECGERPAAYYISIDLGYMTTDLGNLEYCDECGKEQLERLREQLPDDPPETLTPPPDLSSAARDRAREILNRHYDFPTQRLQYKPCLDELTAVLEFYLRKLAVIQDPRVQEDSLRLNEKGEKDD